ncbi:hypothetical protein HDU98_011040 [Podochytrium sp. JEL0797]|nr:hypothetical protein HDU98_011040 [Podochytrium sp. JEL0797]
MHIRSLVSVAALLSIAASAQVVPDLLTVLGANSGNQVAAPIVGNKQPTAASQPSDVAPTVAPSPVAPAPTTTAANTNNGQGQGGITAPDTTVSSITPQQPVTTAAAQQPQQPVTTAQQPTNNNNPPPTTAAQGVQATTQQQPQQVVTTASPSSNTSPSSTNTDSAPSSSGNSGQTIGIVLGTAAGVTLLAFIYFMVTRLSKKKTTVSLDALILEAGNRNSNTGVGGAAVGPRPVNKDAILERPASSAASSLSRSIGGGGGASQPPIMAQPSVVGYQPYYNPAYPQQYASQEAYYQAQQQQQQQQQQQYYAQYQ